MNTKKYLAAMAVLAVLMPSITFAQTTGLTSNQISAIIGLLRAFGADESVIKNVEINLGYNAGAGKTNLSQQTLPVTNNTPTPQTVQTLPVVTIYNSALSQPFYKPGVTYPPPFASIELSGAAQGLQSLFIVILPTKGGQEVGSQSGVTSPASISEGTWTADFRMTAPGNYLVKVYDSPAMNTLYTSATLTLTI